MIVDAAPFTTQRPWVTTTRPSFEVSVSSVSRKFGRFDPLLRGTPSVACGNSMTPGMPTPQADVLVSTPTSPPFYGVSAPKTLPYGTTTARYPVYLLDSFTNAITASTIGLSFF